MTLRNGRTLLLTLAAIGVFTRGAVAQEAAFVFSTLARTTDAARPTIYGDAGGGKQALDVVQTDRAEQRFGIELALSSRWTVVTRTALPQDSRDTGSSQQGELLFSLRPEISSRTSVGGGFGVRHELQGVDVLIGRFVAGRAIQGWRVDGNLVIEKALAPDRDSSDLITSLGVARRVSSNWYAGFEVIGEDLEGFWDPYEADGGARLLLGPSLHTAGRNRHWYVSAAGGPIIRSANLLDGSRRPLRNGDAVRTGAFAAKASITYGF